MAGHLRAHGNRWQLVWKVAGKQHNESWPMHAGETRHQAELRLAEDIGRCLAGRRQRDADSRTVGDLLDMWFAAREFDRANTVRRLTHQLARIKRPVLNAMGTPFGDILAHELEPWMLEDLWKSLKAEGLQASTIREYVAPVVTAYRWARRRKVKDLRGKLQPLVGRDVALAIEEFEMPRRNDIRETRHHIAEWDELLRILDYLDAQHAARERDSGAGRAGAASHWIRSGARPSEIAGLAWRFVNLDEGYCDLEQKTARTRGQGVVIEPVLKTAGSVRRVGISETVRGVLQRQREWQARWKWKMRNRWHNSEGLVYTTHLGGPLAPDDIWREIKRAGSVLGLPDFRPYDLRHAWKSHMRDETNWSADDLSAYQGHSKATGEGTYRHATKSAAAKSRRIAEDFDQLEQLARQQASSTTDRNIG